MKLLLLLSVISVCEPHGRLLEPPSRASMWRLGLPNPPNYNDNQLFCGGKQVQHDQNSGRCGVCGDPWNGPRHHEAGGKYAQGIVARSYQPGQELPVTLQITANHLGYMQFQLCPHDAPWKAVEEECLHHHPLVESSSGKTKLPVNESMVGLLNLRLRIPSNIRCWQCILRWKYIAGNSWGTDKITGEGCRGCGDQEEFYACADVAVGFPAAIYKSEDFAENTSQPTTSDATAEVQNSTGGVLEKESSKYGENYIKAQESSVSTENPKESVSEGQKKSNMREKIEELMDLPELKNSYLRTQLARLLGQALAKRKTEDKDSKTPIEQKSTEVHLLKDEGPMELTTEVSSSTTSQTTTTTTIQTTTTTQTSTTTTTPETTSVKDNVESLPRPQTLSWLKFLKAEAQRLTPNLPSVTTPIPKNNPLKKGRGLLTQLYGFEPKVKNVTDKNPCPKFYIVMDGKEKSKFYTLCIKQNRI